MTVNLDGKFEDAHGYVVNDEEMTQAEAARFVVRAIGNPAIRGYSNHLERAYGRALWIAHRTMEQFGAEIEDRTLPEHRIELRISEDRHEVIVKHVSVMQEMASQESFPNEPTQP